MACDPVRLADVALTQPPELLEAVATPKVDEEWLPLLLFRGGVTVGRMQALWNFCKAMEALEIETTSQVLKLSTEHHDLVHLCGLHAPVQRSTLTGFFSRILYAKRFMPIKRDRHLRDYLQWFMSTNRMWVGELSRISPVAPGKTRQAWRRRPTAPPTMEHWPFLENAAAANHLDIMLVDSLVPKGIPEQWRQDMCQDLFVAILSGELNPDELQTGARRYIKKVWIDHPFKYGDLPIDGGDDWSSSMEAVTADFTASVDVLSGDVQKAYVQDMGALSYRDSHNWWGKDDGLGRVEQGYKRGGRT